MRAFAVNLFYFLNNAIPARYSTKLTKTLNLKTAWRVLVRLIFHQAHKEVRFTNYKYGVM